jgi:phospholipid/cholesterol/gamma-HCH transport system ATP-binding protein
MLPDMVRLEDVHLTLSRHAVLQSVNLFLDSGQVVGLIGPGGSGKTQLIRILSTLQKPTRGTLHFFGSPVTSRRPQLLSALRSRIGLQFQNFALFDHLNVYENVSFGLARRTLRSGTPLDHSVLASLESVGLADEATKLPSELSGGMRRRVAIARVMAAEPDVALFDDPVSGLDPVSSARIMALLGRFSRQTGCLSLIVTHDLQRLLPVVDRLLYLDQGRIEYDGPAQAWQASSHPQFLRFVHAATTGHHAPASGKPEIPAGGTRP